MEMVRRHFRPEFINRIDEFIVFSPLDKAQIKEIVRIQAKRVAKRLAERKMYLELDEYAVEWLADRGFDPVFGARPVKRAVQKELENIIAKALLRGEFQEEDTILVSAGAGGLQLSRGAPRALSGNGVAVV